jgi:hypothetical protein
MAADDFFGLIALDIFGALVPGGDSALGIEQEDGVVFNALDEKPKHIVADEWVISVS